MKLHVVSFGCQMSVADGEEMSRPLLEKGFRPTPRPEEADAILVNTCTVRQHAEDRAVSLIGRLKPWKEENPRRFLIVAGCAAENLKDFLQRRFPYIDLVVGAKSIEQYPEILEEALRARFDWASENRDLWPPENGCAQDQVKTVPPAESAGPVSTYVTVMRGCNYSCSYCIVPSVRGREIYRPLETILAEIRDRVARGAREVMLLGQTVNSYRAPPTDGSEGPGASRFPASDFADLLRAANRVEGLRRIRFMSPHPYYLNDRMIAAMTECGKVCRHLHLPVQSGSDIILKKMRRNHTVRQYLDKLDRLRASIPDIELTTDFIVGFPGETEEDFENTLRLAQAIDPALAYCFKFSPRPGTEAALHPRDGEVPEALREERLGRLLDVVEQGRARRLRGYIGREVEVLLEDDLNGRTERFFNARLDRPGRPGDLVRATVSGVSKTGLRAQAAAGRGCTSLPAVPGAYAPPGAAGEPVPEKSVA